jgi:hypothetical protein
MTPISGQNYPFFPGNSIQFQSTVFSADGTVRNITSETITFRGKLLETDTANLFSKASGSSADVTITNGPGGIVQYWLRQSDLTNAPQATTIGEKVWLYLDDTSGTNVFTVLKFSVTITG